VDFVDDGDLSVLMFKAEKMKHVMGLFCNSIRFQNGRYFVLYAQLKRCSW
jgi:hypothetical protein